MSAADANLYKGIHVYWEGVDPIPGTQIVAGVPVFIDDHAIAWQLLNGDEIAVRRSDGRLELTRKGKRMGVAHPGVPVETKNPLTVNVVVAVKTPQELEADIQAAVQERIDANLLPRRTPC